jgi:hypothetical protein
VGCGIKAIPRIADIYQKENKRKKERDRKPTGKVQLKLEKKIKQKNLE